ncbi:MAG: 4Fe-4S binding protein [Clostridiaceae bacterium]|nr:4Fe-4S binding protein [Clostridiaceae bacterium]
MNSSAEGRKSLNIKIYYFSATGNTKYGLKLLQYYLTSKGHSCKLRTVENEDSICYDCDLLGFASPVYGGYPAKIVMNFIERSKTFTYKVPAFTVLCPCSTMGYWGSREIFMDALSAKNIQVVASLGFLGNPSHPIVLGSIKHGTPFFKSFFDGIGRPNSFDAAQIKEFSEKLITIYRDFSEGKKIKKPGYSKIRRWVSNTVRSREIDLINETSLLVYQDKCVKCGLCQKECPVGALSLEPYPVQNLSKCFSCQKCINICPKHAIYVKGIDQIDYYNRKKLKDEELLIKHTKESTQHLRQKKPIMLRILSTRIGMVIVIMLRGITDKLLIQRK